MGMAKFRKIGLVILVNVVVFEILSFFLIYSIGFIKPDWRLDLTIEDLFKDITEDDLRIARKGRDRLLGWDRKPHDSHTGTNTAGMVWTISWGADGAREDPVDRGQVLIATYGDSFTAGAEVNNDQTWQYFLEELIGYEVKNFGVSGYGTGQAFLKLKKHIGEGMIAPITILAIYPDDLARVVNNFRLFLNRDTHGKIAFKPSFRYLDGEVRFLPNPYDDESMSLSDLKSLAMRSAELDFWMSKWLYLKLEFPFSIQVARAAPLVVRKFWRKIMGRQEGGSIWEDEEGRFVLEHILEEFSAIAGTDGVIPVVVFIPEVRRWKDGRIEPRYAEFKEEFWVDSRHDILAIDVADAEFDESRFLINGFEGHTSPYGNRVIANHIFEKLEEFELLSVVD
jgi:hypothetical protein